MKLALRSEAPMIFQTQTCFDAHMVLEQLPDIESPYGRGDLFARASEDDQTLADSLTIRGEFLRDAFWNAAVTDAVCDKELRRPDTIDEFPGYVINQSEFATFATATLLVATQTEQRAGWHDASVDTARFYGAVLLEDEEAVLATDLPNARLFTERYRDPSTGYRESAAKGAQLLIEMTLNEFVHASPSGDTIDAIPSSTYAPQQVLEQYLRDNPAINSIRSVNA
jgi:hypothetical protein